MSLPLVDTHEFCRRADSAQGSVALASMSRLASLLATPEGELAWSLTGRSALRADGSRQSFLSLQLDARPVMRCVRCLEPVPAALSEQREYRLVGDEDQAAREDADDDDYDVLVASRRFDLAQLIEDEAIMGLPAAPRHADCRAPHDGESGVAAQDGAGETNQPDAPGNPFAVLERLKRPRD